MNTFENLISDIPEDIQAIARETRNILLEDHPQLVEDIGGGDKVRFAMYYVGEMNNMAFVIGPGSDHVKLFLHHFDQIDMGDLKLEGGGKHSRHIKIYPAGDISDHPYQQVVDQVYNIAVRKSRNQREGQAGR